MKILINCSNFNSNEIQEQFVFSWMSDEKGPLVEF